jgi:hypothetical protein
LGQIFVTVELMVKSVVCLAKTGRVTAAVLLIMFVATVCRAQANAPIKGHAIGENLADFLGRVNGGTTYLDSCRQATTKKLAKHLRVDLATCQTLIAGADTGVRFRLNIEKNFPTHDFFNDSDYAIFAGGTLPEWISISVTIGRSYGS